jgi:putative flippase GtrA
LFFFSFSYLASFQLNRLYTFDGKYGLKYFLFRFAIFSSEVFNYRNRPTLLDVVLTGVTTQYQGLSVARGWEWPAKIGKAKI